MGRNLLSKFGVFAVAIGLAFFFQNCGQDKAATLSESSNSVSPPGPSAPPAPPAPPTPPTLPPLPAPAVDGGCGLAQGVATSTVPSSDKLCARGTAGMVNAVVTSGNRLWTWDCVGTGSSGTTAHCSAPRPVTCAWVKIDFGPESPVFPPQPTKPCNQMNEGETPYGTTVPYWQCECY